jgi:CRP-like cAMP-binding protein
MSVRSCVDKKRLLRELPLFCDLASENLGELESGSQILACQRGQTIYMVGNPARRMYIVLSGQVKLSVASNRGNEKVIDVIEAGRSFGEAELFGGQRYLAGAQAVKPTQLLCISGAHLRRAMKMDSRIAVRIIRVLSQRQIEMEAELAASHLSSGNQRLLDFFLGLAGPGRDLVGETQVTIGISKRLLASRFDMQPETLSRTLRELSDAGLIAVDGGRIRLFNARIGRYLADESFSQAIVLPELNRLSHAGAGGYPTFADSAGPPGLIAEFGPACDAINMAGRQRMLSQRMAKSWLMLERGVLSRRARLILRQSISLFDIQLNELATRSNSAEICTAHAGLKEAWQPYRALLDSEPTRKGALELFSINEEVLAAAQRLTLSFGKADGTAKGRLVNLAGRERMLSQSMVKYFMFRRMGIRVSKCRAKLEDANNEFSAALVELTSVTQGKPRITAELDRVSGYWGILRSALAVGNDMEFAATARKAFTASENLLQRMDKAVELCAGLPG